MKAQGDEGLIESSMAKLAASEAARKAADKAMQILASAGYRRGSVAERLFRDARAAEIYSGDVRSATDDHCEVPRRFEILRI